MTKRNPTNYYCKKRFLKAHQSNNCYKTVKKKKSDICPSKVSTWNFNHIKHK